jgi:hypothetical protein
VNDVVYLRRVTNPNPLLEELARQAADRLDAYSAHGESSVSILLITTIAREFGVPLAYVFAEIERRVRDRVPA